LAQVPVEGDRRHPLRLGDVTTVVQDHQPLIGDAASAGSPDLLLMIDKFPGANTLEVTKGIHDALADMAPGLKGITVNPNVYRPVSYLDTALGNLGTVALIALAAALALMFLLLSSWRAAVVALIVVPVSLLLAVCVLLLAGATFTTITLLGLAAAVALVIDDVVTDLDAVRQRFARGDGHDPAQAGLVEAFVLARRPLTFATLAILLALAPLAFLDTLASAFSRPLVLTYALAVLASMLVAVTLTPALTALLLRGKAAGREGPFGRQVKQLFDRRLAGAIARPRRAWAVAGVLAVAALVSVPQIGGRSVLPTLQDRNLLVQMQTMPGTSLPEMDRVTASASRALHAVPGVSSVGAQVGSDRQRQLRRSVDHAGRRGRLRPQQDRDPDGAAELPGRQGPHGHLSGHPDSPGRLGAGRRPHRPGLRTRPDHAAA